VRKRSSLDCLVDAYIRRIVPTRIIHSVIRDVTRTYYRCIAERWHRLMTELGYSRYGAGGKDFGSGVSTFLAVGLPVLACNWTRIREDSENNVRRNSHRRRSNSRTLEQFCHSTWLVGKADRSPSC
jgi:hypothetical protein